MSKHIQILDDQTINQIAAGEVIEDPPSCVKELVENAIDAKAKFIEVRFIAGGRKKIEVIDDGQGMSFDDALLSIERHATSKITQFRDMDTLDTMGFRGEALPSIASISKFILETSNGSEATRLVCHGGKLIDHSVSTRERGTTIEVGSLFFNVPARQKFQKALTYDAQGIIKIMINFALAYPEIHFKLVQDQKEVFNLRSKSNFTDLENLHYRIEALFGKQLSDELIEIDIEKEGISFKGFIAKSNVSRPNRLGQHLYVNKRVVNSKLVSLGVREGYSTRLAENRFPVFFLNMDLDPQKVDVNVHPQKKEVRFKDPFEVKETITRIIDEGIRGVRLPHILRSPVNKEIFFEKTFNTNHPKITHAENIVVVEEERKELFLDPVLDFVPNIIGIYDLYLFVEASSLLSKMVLKKEDEKGLIIVHQKRAHQRILFDALVQRGSKLAIQNLLLPKSLQFSKADSLLLEEFLPSFEELGISIRSLGHDSFILDGLPSIMPMEAAENLIQKTLEEIKMSPIKKSLKEQQKQMIAKFISRSVYFPKIENDCEAKAMLVKLFKCENFEYSPLGKPILLPLSAGDLNKKFK